MWVGGNSTGMRLNPGTSWKRYAENPRNPVKIAPILKKTSMSTNNQIAPDAWETHQKILVILAHPDDPEFFCGATLAAGQKPVMQSIISC